MLYRAKQLGLEHGKKPKSVITIRGPHPCQLWSWSQIQWVFFYAFPKHSVSAHTVLGSYELPLVTVWINCRISAVQCSMANVNLTLLPQDGGDTIGDSLPAWVVRILLHSVKNVQKTLDDNKVRDITAAVGGLVYWFVLKDTSTNNFHLHKTQFKIECRSCKKIIGLCPAFIN